MSHKAFAFDWTRSEADEVYRIVINALSSEVTVELGAYIDANLGNLKDPYEGNPLPEDWREMLESHDVQEFADYLLTRRRRIRLTSGRRG